MVNVWNTVMRRLTTGIRSQKCVVRRFRRCTNVIEYTYTFRVHLLVNVWNTVMRRLTTGYFLRNASLGDFFVVRTS